MPETRPTFHHQLDEVQRDLLRAAARVTESIMRGTQALLSLDLAQAQAIIDGDELQFGTASVRVGIGRA